MVRSKELKRFNLKHSLRAALHLYVEDVFEPSEHIGRKTEEDETKDF